MVHVTCPGREGVRGAPERAGARGATGAGADRQAWLLHRRERMSGARGLGAGAVSRGRLRGGSRAGDRHAARWLRQGVRSRGGGAALPRVHDRSGAAPLLRRVAGPARGLRLARACRAGVSGAPAARSARPGAARAGLRRRLTGTAPRDVGGGQPSPCGASCGGGARLTGRPASFPVRRRLSLERRAGFAALDLDAPADRPRAQEHAP